MLICAQCSFFSLFYFVTDCYVQLEGEFPYEFVLLMDSTVSYLFCIVNICFVCITYSL